jgi:hypothetical protein
MFTFNHLFDIVKKRKENNYILSNKTLEYSHLVKRMSF